MTSKEFVEELERATLQILNSIGGRTELDTPARVNVLAMLRIALRNELEASELAAHWIPSTPELDVKLGLARQVGDEAKHYRLLEARFRDLGGERDFDPREPGYSPLFHFLTSLSTSVERLAAGQFTREAIAQRRNDLFIEYLRKVGDAATAQIYSETIQPDEAYHNELGRSMLVKYATTTELQEAARAASRKTLELAEGMRQRAIEATGIHEIPGC